MQFDKLNQEKFDNPYADDIELSFGSNLFAKAVSQQIMIDENNYGILKWLHLIVKYHS